MKLNLGCGPYYLDGWTNVDFSDDNRHDVTSDVRVLPFEDNVAEEIYCGHIIEHIPWAEIPSTLAEWKRVMSPGGVITITFPDTQKSMVEYLNNRIPTELFTRICCGQDTAEDLINCIRRKELGYIHYSCINSKLMKKALIEAGFTNVREIYSHPHAVNNIAWQTIVQAEK